MRSPMMTTLALVLLLSTLPNGAGFAAKAGRRGAKKPAAASSKAKIGGKGFGSALAAKSAGGGGKLLSEPRYEALYDWLRSSPETNLGKVAVGEFDGLRGVMALQDIGAGEEIVGIPATFAVNLGTDGADPLPLPMPPVPTRQELWVPPPPLSDLLQSEL